MEYLGFINKELILFTIVYTAIVLALNFIWLHRKEWIKEFISEKWDRWESRSGLKKTYYVLASIVVSIFLYSFWFIFPEFLDKIDDKNTSFYNLSLAVFAILSGFGAVFGFYTSIIKTETAEQGQITERLNKAIENLGKSTEGGDPVIEVRIGALYALERIAQDSIRDHIQIMEILCAYIRYNSPLPDETKNTNKITQIKTKRKKNNDDIIDEDIQTALTIIGRRDRWPEGRKRIRHERNEDYSLDLRNCDLIRALLVKANLANAWFQNSNLTQAGLMEAKLSSAWLIDATLTGTWFDSANLCGAWFDDAKMQNTRFNGADTRGAFAHTGDFSKCKNLTPQQVNQMYCGNEVKLPKVRPPNGTKLKKTLPPKHWPKEDLSYDDFKELYDDWLEEKHPDLFETRPK